MQDQQGRLASRQVADHAIPDLAVSDRRGALSDPRRCSGRLNLRDRCAERRGCSGHGNGKYQTPTHRLGLSGTAQQVALSDRLGPREMDHRFRDPVGPCHGLRSDVGPRRSSQSAHCRRTRRTLQRLRSSGDADAGDGDRPIEMRSAAGAFRIGGELGLEHRIGKGLREMTDGFPGRVVEKSRAARRAAM